MTKTFGLLLLIGLGACAMAEEPPRSVTVTGSGFAELAPDEAMVSLSIVVRRIELDAAQREAAVVVNKVLAMAERLDIDRKDIDTTGASVRPDYRWNRQTEEQELRGYIAERSMVIHVDELDKLGEVIEGAVAAGVNQVMPPQLDSSKRRDAYRQALRAAADDAKQNALAIAETLGAELGEVISISAGADVSQPPIPMSGMVRAMAVESDAAETYNPAELKFSANVTAVFQLTSE